MRTGFDQLAKRIGKQALGPSGLTVVHDEIHPDAQHADLRHEPDPACGAERARLGLLGQMAEVPCILEVYAHAPGGEELRACLGKHIAFWQERVRAARKARKRRVGPAAAGPKVEPFLWIVAACRPSAVLASLKFEASPGWPEGVYELSDMLRIGIVSAGELPRDRSTLLVRLMAAGPLLGQAIADLAALPPDAHERAVASQILLGLRRALQKKTRRTPEEQEFIMRMEIDFVEQLRDEGREEGRALGRTLLRRLLAARELVPSRVEDARIDACEDISTLARWADQAMTAQTVAEALRGEAPGRAAPRRRRSARPA